jgi:hypothetical protein
MRSRLPLLLLLLSCNAMALEYPVEIIESVDNSRVVAFINIVDIDASAEWMPFESTPKLSMTDALAAVQSTIAADPALAGITLVDIELRQIPNHPGHWHYLLRMKMPNAEKPATHYFIVLMNGKVVRGLREPQAVK